MANWWEMLQEPVDPDAKRQRSDKGKKRKRYIQIIRHSRKMINDLKRTISDIEKFESQEVKRAVKADRNKRKILSPAYKKRATERSRKRRLDPYKRAKDVESQRIRRINARIALIPEKRICPICNEVKFRSKQWVNNKVLGMICKSCHELSKRL